MMGSIFGALSGGAGVAVSSATGLAVESFAYRGITAAIDGALSLGNYLSQNAVNGTMRDVSLVGSMIAFGGGLLDFCYPIWKYTKDFFNPTLCAELGWIYDVIRTGKKKRKNELL